MKRVSRGLTRTGLTGTFTFMIRLRDAVFARVLTITRHPVKGIPESFTDLRSPASMRLEMGSNPLIQPELALTSTIDR